MQIGRRVYFEISTGNVILDKGEMQGSVIQTTIEQDIENFIVLSERTRDSFDYIELAFGDHSQDFANCNGVRVNVDTKTLEFSFPSDSQELPVFQKPITEQVAEVKAQLVQQNADLQGFMDFYFSTLA
jgi:hypothetical protein